MAKEEGGGYENDTVVVLTNLRRWKQRWTATERSDFSGPSHHLLRSDRSGYPRRIA